MLNISSYYSTDISATTLPTTVLCSPCVLSMYQLFQQTAYSYYDESMASDWSNIQNQCNVSYPTSVPTNPTNVTSIPGFAPLNYTTPTTCYSGSTYSVVPGDDCVSISKANNVSTGALINVNDLLPDCSDITG
jgi:hypothetical protein